MVSIKGGLSDGDVAEKTFLYRVIFTKVAAVGRDKEAVEPQSFLSKSSMKNDLCEAIKREVLKYDKH